MDQYEGELKQLVNRGNSQGYLTYDEVNAYLPDEDVTPEKLDNLLIALEEMGIELVDEPPADAFEDPEVSKGPTAEEVQRKTEQESLGLLAAEEIPKLSDDPIRMYLSQMAEIPLLTRDEEISLAKKIEVTRKTVSSLAAQLRLRHAKHLRTVVEGPTRRVAV